MLARVGGPARAGGLGLITAADIAVCAREATFGFSEVRIGVIPAIIAVVCQPVMTPRAFARHVLTGAVFDAAEAESLAVVETGDQGRPIGILTEAHAMRRYAEESERRRREAVGED